MVKDLTEYELRLIDELKDAKLSWKTVLKMFQLYAIETC